MTIGVLTRHRAACSGECCVTRSAIPAIARSTLASKRPVTPAKTSAVPGRVGYNLGWSARAPCGQSGECCERACSAATLAFNLGFLLFDLGFGFLLFDALGGHLGRVALRRLLRGLLGAGLAERTMRVSGLCAEEGAGKRGGVDGSPCACAAPSWPCKRPAPWPTCWRGAMRGSGACGCVGVSGRCAEDGAGKRGGEGSAHLAVMLRLLGLARGLLLGRHLGAVLCEGAERAGAWA